jgi:hypothetical protein
VLERVQQGNQRQATLTYDLPQPGEKPARVLSFLTREGCGGRSGFHLWIQICSTPSMLRNADQFSRRCRAVETANILAVRDPAALGRPFPQVVRKRVEAGLAYTRRYRILGLDRVPPPHRRRCNAAPG